MEPNTRPGETTTPRGLGRLLGSAVVWSWLFSGLRLASGLVLLPLLSRLLPVNDFGVYYVFVQLGTVVPMMDFGFSLSVERSLAYARAGASSLEALGVGAIGNAAGPNRTLMAEIAVSSRRLYRWLSVGAFVLLSVAGTVSIGLGAALTVSPERTWVAWGIWLVSLSLELYTSYWVAVLRGLNEVTTSARWLSVAYGLRLLLSAVLLLAGTGLLAVPVASLVSGIVLRAGAGRVVRRLLPAEVTVPPGDVRRILRLLWPNSWRLGLQLVALFAASYAFTVICVAKFGPATNGVYGLSVQIMNIAVGIAAVWVTVKWPVVAKLRMEGRIEDIRALIRPRFWLQTVTYAGLAGAAIVLGPWLLRWVAPDKALLAWPLLLLLALNSFGELNFAFWTTLISTENRIPALWGYVATQSLGVLVAWVLVFRAGHGLEALVVVPLVLGTAFNYWWWAREGARMLGTTYPRFLFGSVRSGAGTTVSR